MRNPLTEVVQFEYHNSLRVMLLMVEAAKKPAAKKKAAKKK